MMREHNEFHAPRWMDAGERVRLPKPEILFTPDQLDFETPEALKRFERNRHDSDVIACAAMAALMGAAGFGLIGWAVWSAWRAL